jgi:hypothetical protein
MAQRRHSEEPIWQSLCQKQLALIKEMNSFTYGGVSDNFYLMVSTLKYKRTQPQ